jgi:2-polyprenyl-6-methoxyphenol hydroxylase-like FAD-dependent oxidoreductase
MGGVIVCGGGACGLLTAILLAKDGHQVTVLERDQAPPPAADEAWESWERRGVNQFRLPHFLLPAFQAYAKSELPGLTAALEAAGALRFNFLGPVAATVDPEGRYDTVTARRPILESVIAAVAEATSGVRIRRGVALSGLVWGPEFTSGIPHVRGVRTDSGQEITADLVIDAMGRRSPLQRWIAADGHNPGSERVEDSGFIYYGCHIHTDGDRLGPLINYYGSVSVLGLPADNGTAGVGIVGWSGDADLRPLRNESTWRSAIKLFPEGERILSGTMIGGIVSMAGIEDRRRRFVVDGRPVITGVLAVGDAWAATNPTLGRGISLGLRHVLQLRKTIDAVGLGQPFVLAETFDDITERDLGPWYDSTIWHDRWRLRDTIAAAKGTEPLHDPDWALFLKFTNALGGDPQLGIRFLETVTLTETPNQMVADPDIVSQLVEAPSPEAVGPTRAELLAALAN